MTTTQTYDEMMRRHRELTVAALAAASKTSAERLAAMAALGESRREINAAYPEIIAGLSAGREALRQRCLAA